jgi:AraC-like DNA-binding protein
MSKYNTISPYYVSALLQGAIRLGLDVQSLVDSSDLGLVFSDLCENTDKMDRIEPDKVSELIRKVWFELNDEFMGFTDQACKRGVFAIVAKLLIEEQTLGQALRNASYLYSTLRNDIYLRYEEKPYGVELSLDLVKPELDEGHFLVEFFLLIWHRFSNWLVAERIRLKYVMFKYPSPAHVEEYSLLFPCHCRFNCSSNALVFESESMNLTIKQGDKELRQFLINSPADLLSKPDFQRSFSTQVMNLILNEDNSFKSLTDLARYFNMSSRNLRRRLSEENRSYVEIKQQLREERAISLLNDERMSISQVGQDLGFVDLATFSRAFKNWTGLSPRHYREKYTNR